MLGHQVDDEPTALEAVVDALTVERVHARGRVADQRPVGPGDVRDRAAHRQQRRGGHRAARRRAGTPRGARRRRTASAGAAPRWPAASRWPACRRRCSPGRRRAGRSSRSRRGSRPSSPRSSRWLLIHGSSCFPESTYERAATPYAVSRCHSRPSFLPSGERTPSATTRRSQATSKRSRRGRRRTPATRPPSIRTSTARAPSIPWAPALIAVVRRWSSSSVRATAEP